MASGGIDFRFYLVTDRRAWAPRPLEAVVRAACEGGVRAVQFREKDLAGAERAAAVARLLEITRRFGARLFVNLPGDRARDAAGVDGVHLPEGAPFPHGLRRLPRMRIGMSVHDARGAAEAQARGADFVVFGPVYETASKPGARPRGIDALRETVRAVRIPVFAIGGVTPERAAECRAAGAHGVAAIRAVGAADDPAAVVARFAEALGGL